MKENDFREGLYYALRDEMWHCFLNDPACLDYIRNNNDDVSVDVDALQSHLHAKLSAMRKDVPGLLNQIKKLAKQKIAKQGYIDPKQCLDTDVAPPAKLVIHAALANPHIKIRMGNQSDVSSFEPSLLPVRNCGTV